MNEQELIGNTGKKGYEVPPSVTKENIELFGNWVTNPKNRKGVRVRVHKSFRVPVNIEELVCIDTGKPAKSPIPVKERENWKRYSKKRKEELPTTFPHEFDGVRWQIDFGSRDRPNQFDMVAWQCEKTGENADGYKTEDSMENIEIGPWRMGYVMNDCDRILRVMIPSGQLYYLKAETVVYFTELSHYCSRVVSDRKCVKRGLDKYIDDDWDISNDYEEDGVDNTTITRFVKDVAYPLDGQGRNKRKYIDLDVDATYYGQSRFRTDLRDGKVICVTCGQHVREKLVVGDCKGADELSGRV